jgi:hypothetical protein
MFIHRVWFVGADEQETYYLPDNTLWATYQGWLLGLSVVVPAKAGGKPPPNGCVVQRTKNELPIAINFNLVTRMTVSEAPDVEDKAAVGQAGAVRPSS